MEEPPKMSKDEQVGFHKGAIDTLVKERTELIKIVNIVDSLLKAHVEALKKLGIDLTRQPAPKVDDTPLEGKL